MTELLELTVKDLLTTTWDYGNLDIVGTVNGQVIRRHCWDLPGHPFQLTLRRCNVAEGWAEFALFENPVDMRKRVLSPDDVPLLKRGPDGSVILHQHKYKGPLLIYSPNGHRVVTLSA